MENLPLPLFEQIRTKIFLHKRFVVFGVCFLFILFLYFLLFSAPKDFKAQTTINIKEGASLRSISSDMERDEIIRSRVLFETFVILLGDEKKIEAGDYFFEKKLSVFEVARRVSKGEKNLAPVRVTIPEGFTTAEISEAFSARLANFDKENFASLTKDKEGYLFPDTYFFLTTDDEESVFASLSQNFEEKIKLLEIEIKKSGKTEREIMIMASLVEGEAKGDKDREYISGILWKRLKIGMPLQVDVAPDTYKTKGLPKNPINNPGLKSIKAAIYPKASSYLYYLHDKNGNIHYASNFEQHKINIQKYLK